MVGRDFIFWYETIPSSMHCIMFIIWRWLTIMVYQDPFDALELLQEHYFFPYKTWLPDAKIWVVFKFSPVVARMKNEIHLIENHKFSFCDDIFLVRVTLSQYIRAILYYSAKILSLLTWHRVSKAAARWKPSGLGDSIFNLNNSNKK